MSQGLLPRHPAARALVEWLNQASGEPLSWQLRARLAWNAFWFERLLPAQNGQGVRTSSPAFIMGFWRSGTTLLHNLLYKHYECATPLTWQCFAPASFSLQRPPLRDASVQRPMDEGIVHLLGPQEDEIALLLLGEPSLYRAFLDPSRLHEVIDACFATDIPTLARWRMFVNTLTTGDVPLLLKSPNHAFRLNMIEELWPRAGMVWMSRPFTDVLVSNARMWRAMIDLHSLRRGEPDLTGFLKRLAVRYRDTVVNSLDREDYPMLWLEYDDLIANPHANAAAAAQFLGFSPRLRAIDGIDARPHSSRTRPNSLVTDPELQAVAQEIDRVHAVAAARWGRKR